MPVATNELELNSELTVGMMDHDDMEVETSSKMLPSGRTLDEIDDIITLAKLDKDDLQPVSQEILFGSNFSTKEFRLLQLEKGVLENMQAGQVLVFRGDEHDSAVLCTDTETYEIKVAETSNSLLLFEDLAMPEVRYKSPRGSTGSGGSANTSLSSSTSTDNLNNSVLLDDGDGKENKKDGINIDSRNIIDIAHTYLEMKKMRPNFSKIKFILRGAEYDGTESSKVAEAKFLTFQKLLDKVPSSELELRNYLDENRVLEINGKLRLVDDDYLFMIFSQVLNCVDENSWNMNEIDKDVVMDALSSSSLAKPFFIEKIFQWFLKPYEGDDGTAAGTSSSSSKVKYTFLEDKVCCFLGEVILRQSNKFNLKEFIRVWQQSVPEGLKVNLRQLSGIAVADEDSSPPEIWHFPEHNLPESFTERLALLFETKKRWKLDDISPYIEIFAPPSQNVGNLLTKYARSTTVNGVKYFFSKHGR